jgi:hypothetical protein
MVDSRQGLGPTRTVTVPTATQTVTANNVSAHLSNGNYEITALCDVSADVSASAERFSANGAAKISSVSASAQTTGARLVVPVP